MSVVLVFDTETTGLPLWKEPDTHAEQPHLVQVAALLVDTDTKKTLSSLNVLVRPLNWTIPAEATAIHGITQQQALDLGVPEFMAVEMLTNLCRGRVRVAHNESFDARIIRIATLRYEDEDAADIWDSYKGECTMAMARKVIGGKNPKLSEAYKHFTGQDLVGAHSAIVDAQACKAIYLEMLNRGGEPK